MSEIIWETFYDSGNTKFKNGDYNNALTEYASALQNLVLYRCDSSCIIRILLNQSLCHLLLRNYTEAINSCLHVLKLDPKNIKALIRCSKAYECIGDFRRGLKFAAEAIAANPTKSLMQEAHKTHHRLKQLSILDDKLLQHDKPPESFITENQTLRLSFLIPPPITYVFATEIYIKVCIVNEFGLWSRGNLVTEMSESICKVTINCEVIPLNISTEIDMLKLPNADESYATSVSDCRTNDSCSVDESSFHNRSYLKVQNSEYLGADGKVTIELKIDPTERLSPSECSHELVMLRFYCSDRLPSGASVLDLYSLPILCVTAESTLNAVHASAETPHLPPNVPVDNFTASASVSSSTTRTTVPTFLRSFAAHDEGLESVRMQALGASEQRLLKLGSSVEALGIRCVSVLDKRVWVLESPGMLGIAGKVWDSSFVLLEYLALSENRELVQGRGVLELGSGTGISGIYVAGCLQPRFVLLTDMAGVEPLLTDNVALNQLVGDPSLGTALRSNCSCATFQWGCPPPESAWLMEAVTDGSLLIVASDVVYDPVGYQPLIDTLSTLLIHPSSLCILAHRHRHPEDGRFFEMLSAVSSLQLVEQAVGPLRGANVDHAYAADELSESTMMLADIRIFHISYRDSVIIV